MKDELPEPPTQTQPEPRPLEGPTPSSRLPTSRSLATRLESWHDLGVWTLRLAENIGIGLLILAVLASACLWAWEDSPALDEILKVLNDNWKGAVVLFLVLLTPTIRDLTERLKSLPGGTMIRPKVVRPVPTSEEEAK